MPGKHNAGGCGCCVTRPCCADVWDHVRTGYSKMRVTLLGTTVSPDPTSDYPLYESLVSGGVTFYQCSAGTNLSEAATSDITLTSGVYRTQYGAGIDPGTGQCAYIMAEGDFALSVPSCAPETVRVEGSCSYGLRFDSDPDWVADHGFTCVQGSPCTKWERTDGFTTTIVEKDWRSTSGCIAVPYLITAVYLQDVTSLPGGLPFPVDVEPSYNPASIKTRIERIV